MIEKIENEENDEEWQTFDNNERNERIEIFEEIRKNPRLCQLIESWYDNKQLKYGRDLWYQLFEGWRDCPPLP